MPVKTHHCADLDLGEIRLSSRNNPTGLTSSCKFFLILVILNGLLPLSVFGQNSDSEIKWMPDYTRYLIVVDNTFSMRKYDASIEKASINWLDTGLDGRVSGGDGFTIWSYSDFGPTPLLPTTTWRNRSQDRLLNQSLIALNGISFFSRNRSFEIFQELQKALQREIPLCVLWITDGKSEFRGSPFDLDIQKILKDQQSFVNKNKIPFVVTIEASAGEWQAWAVNRLTLAAPPLLLPAQPAFDKQETLEESAPTDETSQIESIPNIEILDTADVPAIEIEVSDKNVDQVRSDPAQLSGEEINLDEADDTVPDVHPTEEPTTSINNSDSRVSNINPLPKESLDASKDVKSAIKKEDPPSNKAPDPALSVAPSQANEIPENSEELESQSDDKTSRKIHDQHIPSLNPDSANPPLEIVTEIQSTAETPGSTIREPNQTANPLPESETPALTSNQVVNPSSLPPTPESKEKHFITKIWPKIFGALCFLMLSMAIGYFLIQLWKKGDLPKTTSNPSWAEDNVVKGSLITATMAQDSKKRKNGKS